MLCPPAATATSMKSVPAVVAFGATRSTLPSLDAMRTVTPPVGAGASSVTFIARCSPAPTVAPPALMPGVDTVTVVVPLLDVVMKPGIDAVTVAVGQSNTPTSGAGAVALDPLTAGTTTVTVASAQARTTTQNGVVNVTVSAPALTISTGTLGSGLQRQGFVQLGAAAPAGGVTVRLTSSQPSVVVLSTTAAAQGTGFIDVTIPAGVTQGSFFAQALDGQTGTPTIQATAPGYSDGTIAQQVVTPALEIISLNSSMLASAVNDPFYVRVGIANANNQFLTEVLDRRGGGTPLTVTATNSNATAGQLLVVGGATGQSVAATIAAGQSNTPTSGTGSFAFDPLAAGSTTVTATIPGFNTTITNGVVNVTVQAGLIQALGAGVR